MQSARRVIFLVRHGEVENPSGVRYGRLKGFGLSPRGVAQAKAAADWIAGSVHRPEAMVSSPLERALETAGAIANALSLPVETSDALLEVASRLEGLPRSTSFPALVWASIRLRHVPYESPWEVSERVVPFLRAQWERYACSVVVSHQHPIQFASASLVSPSRFLPPRGLGPCTPGSVTSLEWDGTRAHFGGVWCPPT